MDNTEKELTEALEQRHKTAFEAVTKALKKAQKIRIFKDNHKEEALHALEENFIDYIVRDNSEFVFETMKKCIEKKSDCSTLKIFFASMPDDEMHAVAGVMKRCMLTICK